MKLKLFSIILLVFIGPVFAQVDLGPGVIVQQDDADINVSDTFSVEQVGVYTDTSDFDNSNFTINPDSGSLDINLSYYNRDAALGSYLTNYSGNVTQPNNVNFTFSNLGTGYYLAKQNNSRLRNEKSVNNLYWFNSSTWNLAENQNFTVLHNLDDVRPYLSKYVLTPENPVYRPSKPVNVTVDATLNDDNTGLNQSFIATNETHDWKNYTKSYGGKKTFNGELQQQVQFYWDNKDDIFQRGNIHIAVWVQDRAGNWNRSEEKIIKIEESPRILSADAEDVSQYEEATVKAKAVDPVGFGDIVNVTFKVETPSGDKYTLTGNRGRRIVEEETNYTGNVYAANFTHTEEAGNYIVNAVVYDEGSSDSERVLMQVGGLIRLLRKLFLDPLHLGQSNVIAAAALVLQKNPEMIFATFIPIIIIVGTIFYTNNGIRPEFLTDRLEKPEMQPEPNIDKEDKK